MHATVQLMLGWTDRVRILYARNSATDVGMDRQGENTLCTLQCN